VISIEDLKVYVYGEGKGYNQRVALIYDNIHYDPLALTFEKNLPEVRSDINLDEAVLIDWSRKWMSLFSNLETTLFWIRPKSLQSSLERYLVAEEQYQKRSLTRHSKASQFVNVSKFTLRCLVCQAGLVGQKEAVEHAKTTGHTNFAEYNQKWQLAVYERRLCMMFDRCYKLII